MEQARKDGRHYLLETPPFHRQGGRHKVKYLRAQDFILLHDLAVEETGGSHGIRSIETLEAAAERPKTSFAGKDLYPDIFSKSASVMHSLIASHPFVDGNKRTAIHAAMTMLELNGYRFKASQKEVIAFTLKVATEKTSVEEIAAWFKKHSKRVKR